MSLSSKIQIIGWFLIAAIAAVMALLRMI